MAVRFGKSTEWIETAFRANGIVTLTFSPDIEQKYVEILEGILAAERLRDLGEKEVEVFNRPAIEPVTFPCPLCGEKAMAGRDWHGKKYRGNGYLDARSMLITRKKGEWDCTKDHRHYLWDRANAIAKAMGYEPHSLEWWEAYDGQAKAQENLERIRGESVDPERD